MPTAIANGLALPNPLSNGSVADAVPVMADFNYLLAVMNRALLDTGGGAGMNAQSVQIHNLASGTSANDAVNLSQLSGFLALGGGTLTGGLLGTTLSLSSTLAAVGASTLAALTASGLITGNAGFAGTTLSLSGAATLTSGTFSSTLGATGQSTLGNVTGTPNGSAVGGLGFLGVPPNVYTTSQTISLAHMGSSADFNGTTLTATITSGLPNGWATLITNINASPLTIASSADTMYLSGTTTTGSRTLGQNGVVGVRRVNGVLIIGGTALS